MSGPWDEYKDEAGPWSEYASAEPMRDAPADSQPSGNTPPPDSNFEVAGRYPAPGSTPSYAPPTVAPQPGMDLTRALFTNEPTQGMGEAFVRGIPAAVGGLVGGVAGAGAATIPLAGLGGMAGESARQGIAQAYAGATNRPFTPPSEVMKDIGIQGASQAGGQAIGLGIGTAAKAARPLVNKIGAQVMRVGAGIPERAGEMAMRNPSMLLDAPSPEAASAAYKTFEATNGITGLGDAVKSAGRFPSEGELEKQLFEVAARARNGVASTPKELYHASQAASSLNQMGKLGNPRYAMLRSAISEAKGAVDDALEAAIPGYGALRGDYAASKAAGEFSSLLPLNKNTSPNVLRGVTAASAAGAGLMAGQPMALAALPLISPKFYGTALKGAAIAGKVPTTVYRVGTQAGAGASGSALADYYGRLNNQIPQADPAFQSIGGMRPAP